MKQETIGSKGTVPGFRPLIGAERWHKDTFTSEMLDEGWRPCLFGETGLCEVSYKGTSWNQIHKDYESEPCTEKHCYCRTKRPLPPPAVETFEAHGHIWYKHTPGDECPVEPDVEVDVLLAYEKEVGHRSVNELAIDCDWGHFESECNIIGYRFPDYPAVHTTSQQSQQSDTQLDVFAAVDAARQRIKERERIKEQLTSIYNGWVHLPPETVAECIADVASVLYPTDAERCEAAFQRWWDGRDNFMASKTVSKASWHAAWKAAKESK